MNAGKRFELAIKKSIPNNCLYYRICDSTGNFSGGSNLRFSSKQPCDAFIFNSDSGTLFAVEMKTTKNGSMSFEDWTINDRQPNKMIHKHQVLSLKKFDAYDNVVAGFLFNFRNDASGTERTYFQSVSDFEKMAMSIGKMSFREKDIANYSYTEISGHKMRVNYIWDLAQVLNMKKGKLNG